MATLAIVILVSMFLASLFVERISVLSTSSIRFNAFQFISSIEDLNWKSMIQSSPFIRYAVIACLFVVASILVLVTLILSVPSLVISAHNFMSRVFTSIRMDVRSYVMSRLSQIIESRIASHVDAIVERSLERAIDASLARLLGDSSTVAVSAPTVSAPTVSAPTVSAPTTEGAQSRFPWKRSPQSSMIVMVKTAKGQEKYAYVLGSMIADPNRIVVKLLSKESKPFGLDIPYTIDNVRFIGGSPEIVASQSQATVNHSASDDAAFESEMMSNPIAKKRGRPVGSKNKSSATATQATPIVPSPVSVSQPVKIGAPIVASVNINDPAQQHRLAAGDLMVVRLPDGTLEASEKGEIKRYSPKTSRGWSVACRKGLPAGAVVYFASDIGA